MNELGVPAPIGEVRRPRLTGAVMRRANLDFALAGLRFVAVDATKGMCVGGRVLRPQQQSNPCGGGLTGTVQPGTREFRTLCVVWRSDISE